MTRSKTNKRPKDCPYVGKGGLKLRSALDHFALDVSGLNTVDLGCNVGGFTDCLLQAGAERVHAVDTSYGLLAWKLRTDERVSVYERTNALHWDCPEPVDLVVADMGWTRQNLVLPLAAKMLKPGAMVLSLVKPQYEAPKEALVKGVLPEEALQEVLDAVLASLPEDLHLVGTIRSAWPGSGGNTEYWLLATRRTSQTCHPLG